MTNDTDPDDLVTLTLDKVSALVSKRDYTSTGNRRVDKDKFFAEDRSAADTLQVLTILLNDAL